MLRYYFLSKALNCEAFDNHLYVSSSENDETFQYYSGGSERYIWHKSRSLQKETQHMAAGSDTNVIDKYRTAVASDSLIHQTQCI